MRVCIIAPRFVPSMGKPAFYMARELRNIGHEVIVITSDLDHSGRRIKKDEEMEGVKTIRLRGFIFKKKVIIPNSIIKLLAADADVFQLDGFGHLITTYASWLKKLKKIAVVLRADWSSHKIISTGFKGVYDRYIKFLALINSDIITVFSEQQKQKMINYGIKSDKIVVLPNGVDYERFAKAKKNDYLKNKFNLDKQTTIILCIISRMIPFKNLEFAIKVLSEVRKVHKKICLVIVGSKTDKNYYQSLLSLIKKLKLRDAVFFHPPVHHKEIQKVYMASDIFVLPSRPEEGMNLSTLEAMVSGLPVITTPVNVTSDIVEKAKCGFVVDSLDSFVEALETLINDNNLRKMMGKRGRNFVKRYSWRNIVFEINGIYKKLIEEK